MNKLKVVLIVTGFPTSDNPTHGIFNKRAADQLSEYVDLTVFQLRVWRPGRKFVTLIENPNYTHYSIASPHLPFGNESFLCVLVGFYDKIIRSKLKDSIYKADVFHSVGASFSGALGSRLALNFKKSHVMQLIGTDVNTELPRLKNLSCFKHLNEITHGIGCNSMALKHEYEKLMGKSQNIEVIYRGIDTDKFKYYFDDFSDGKVRFLFLGGIPYYKHLELGRNLKGGINLMNVWKKNEEKLATLNCELVFAGPDSDSDIAKDWHNSLQNKEIVTLKGSLTPDKVLQEYNNSHVVLIPSLEEGMPNVALEAGATGKCIIASNVGGLPELISDKDTGYLFNPGVEEEFAKAIIHCAENHHEVKEMGVILRKNIAANFSSKDFAPKYTQLYEIAMRGIN